MTGCREATQGASEKHANDQKTTGRLTMLFPRINNIHSGMLKIMLIAGGKAVTPVQGDGSDEGVDRPDQSSLFFQPAGEFSPDHHDVNRDVENPPLKSDQ